MARLGSNFYFLQSSVSVYEQREIEN